MKKASLLVKRSHDLANKAEVGAFVGILVPTAEHQIGEPLIGYQLVGLVRLGIEHRRPERRRWIVRFGYYPLNYL